MRDPVLNLNIKKILKKFFVIIFTMKKSSNAKLVISMKSSSVEISVINLDKTPELLFAKKEKLLFQEVLTSSDFIDKSFSVLQRLLRGNSLDISTQLKDSRECEVIFHSPWFLPELVSEKNKGQKISLKKFFNDKVIPPKQDDYIQIENKITNILLNGYHLTKLKDEESSDIEINIFRSYISKETGEKIKEILKKEFNNLNVFDFSSSAMQNYESLKSLFINEDNFIFFNIGGEITELGVVENDILTFSSTVPVGTHLFSRELDTFIAEKGNLDSLSFLSNKSTDEKLDKVRLKKIEKIKKIWSEEVISNLKDENKSLPKKVFIISNSDTIEFFNMLLESCDLCEDFTFFIIKPEIFSEKVKVTGKIPNKNVEYLLSSYYLSIKS